MDMSSGLRKAQNLRCKCIGIRYVWCFLHRYFAPHYVGVPLLYVESDGVLQVLTFLIPRPSFPNGGFCFGIREMRRVFVFLFVMFPFSGFANCVSADQVTKCARLPTEYDWNRPVFSGFVYGADGLSWSLVYDSKVVVSGTSSGGGFMEDVACTISYPFKGNYVVPFEPSFSWADYAAQVCTDEVQATGLIGFSVVALDGDVCPDGFYTVPYEIDCGEGFVDVADVAHCDEDTSGDFCLMSLSAAPCAAGITMLRTGTGVVVPLWAEKVTSPSLCVKYNDNICYANLEAGQATGAINVNYDGVVYHLVD